MLTGGLGSDTLNGGTGNDTLVGDLGDEFPLFPVLPMPIPFETESAEPTTLENGQYGSPVLGFFGFADTFVIFGPDSGNDFIDGFTLGQDIVAFGGGWSPDDVEVIARTDSSVQLILDDGNGNFATLGIDNITATDPAIADPGLVFDLEAHALFI